LLPEEETTAALARIQSEERTRLERVWEANRLELLHRSFGRLAWPSR